MPIHVVWFLCLSEGKLQPVTVNNFQMCFYDLYIHVITPLREKNLAKSFSRLRYKVFKLLTSKESFLITVFSASMQITSNERQKKSI